MTKKKPANTENTQAPHISVVAQYLKDLSFENPNAPEILKPQNTEPKISLDLDVGVKKIEENNIFEVALSITAKTTVSEKTLFIVDVKYAGLFNLVNVKEEMMGPLLGVDCASIIFPFVHKIIADATQAGGFQPLMLDPIDFASLYTKRMKELQAEQEKAKKK